MKNIQVASCSYPTIYAQQTEEKRKHKNKVAQYNLKKKKKTSFCISSAFVDPSISVNRINMDKKL